MAKLRRVLLVVKQSTQRYWMIAMVLGVALLTAQSALAADVGTSSFMETAQSFIGGVLAAMLINLVTQRHRQRVESKVASTEKKVDSLTRELGVDDPNKNTPDITKMQAQINGLQTDLNTVKNELVRTLQERDTARDLAANQVEKNAENTLNAQSQIDQLTTDLQSERDISSKLEKQLNEYDKRFTDQALQMARIEGRLDQQAIQDQWSGNMQTLAKLLNDVSARLNPTPEGNLS